MHLQVTCCRLCIWNLKNILLRLCNTSCWPRVNGPQTIRDYIPAHILAKLYYNNHLL